jgi:hypothetical protein
MASRHKAVIAGAVALLALLLIPAPLLPPLGLAGKVQSMLGVSWKAAYFATAIGLQVTLYGLLGLLAAMAVGPGRNSRGRWCRLLLTPPSVVGIELAIRSLKLGHVPVAANAVVPMAACGLGVLVGLLFQQRGWKLAAAAVVLLPGAMLWAWWPSTSSEVSLATEAQLRQLVAAAPELPPAGDARFGALLRTAFAVAPDAPRCDVVEQNSAAILALGIALGHQQMARCAGLDPKSELVRAAAGLRGGTVLQGRGDWAQHYCVSASLVVVGNPFISDAAGLVKEQLDALPGGSGFSFGDLAADRAGVRFAQAATGSEAGAQAMRARVETNYSEDDFFPPASDLPENLTLEQFREKYGGAGSPRYRETMGEIEMRLNRCAALNGR